MALSNSYAVLKFVIHGIPIWMLERLILKPSVCAPPPLVGVFITIDMVPDSISSTTSGCPWPILGIAIAPGMVPTVPSVP